MFNYGLDSSVSSIDPEAARIIVEYAAQHVGSQRQTANLRFNGLTTLSQDVAHELAKFPGGVLQLNGVPTIDADAALELARFQGNTLALNGLTTLSEDAARELAQFAGQQIGLSGLPTLSDAAAAALAKFGGETLLLRGATQMPASAMNEVLSFEGSMLVLPRIKTLDLETAEALVASPKWDGQLPEVTAIASPDAVAVAKALAKRKGRLSLPNLNIVSPKTLTALLQKSDIEIPLIETLKLIPEPDGSPTEDFVIPEGFQQRQNQQR